MFFNPNFLKASYWFDLTPPSLAPGMEQIMFGFFGAVLLLGIIVRLVAKHHTKDDKHLLKGFKRTGVMFLTMGFLGLIFFFFSFERIQFLGARFWYLFWGVGLLVWIGFIINYFVRVIPREREREVNRSKVDKYMPRAKKRK